MCTELCVRASVQAQAFLLMCTHIIHACAGMLGAYTPRQVVSVGICMNCRCRGLHGSVYVDFLWRVCTQIWWQVYAHAWHKSMCPWSCEVGELQVLRARTQAAGARAGHVCAQLRVLAAGKPDAQCAPCSR